MRHGAPSMDPTHRVVTAWTSPRLLVLPPAQVDDRSSKLSSRGTTCAEGTDGGLGVAGFAGTPGPRCARFRPCFGTAWPAVELWGTMDIRRSPDRCALLEHDLEAYGRTEKRCRMGVGGGGAAPRAHGLQRCLMASYGEAAVSNGGRTGVASARARSPKESAELKGLRSDKFSQISRLNTLFTPRNVVMDRAMSIHEYLNNS